MKTPVAWTNMREIEKFYELLQGGIAVLEFNACFYRLLDHLRSQMMIPDYRAGKGTLKRLREEVAPTSHYLRSSNAQYEKIQFPLNNGDHDCKVWDRSSQKSKTIEITAAKGAERYYLMTELNEFGHAPGFLGLSNNADRQMFKKLLSRDREAYSTDKALNDMIEAAKIVAMNKKDNLSDILLVEVPLNTLPSERWSEIEDELKTIFSTLSFSEVHFVSEDGEFCWQLR